MKDKKDNWERTEDASRGAEDDERRTEDNCEEIAGPRRNVSLTRH